MRFQMTHGRLADPATERTLFWLCWLAYVTTYLGRLNYSACLMEISGTEGWSKGEAGLIATAFFTAYGLGQLVNGVIGDKLSPRIMVSCGLFCSGLVNLAFPAIASPSAAAVLWGLNGFVQSMVWSPLIRLLSEWLPAEKRLKACVNMNGTVPVGTLAAYGMSAGLVYLASWKNVFYTSGTVLIAMSLVFFLMVGRLEKTVRPVQEQAPLQKDSASAQVVHGSFLRLVITCGIPLFCIAALMQGMLKDGVTTWIPTFLGENFNLASSAAILSTTVVPIVNLGGVYLADWLNHRYFKNEVLAAACFFVAGLAALVGLICAGSSAVLSLVLLAATTTCMMGINTLLVGMTPAYYVHWGLCSTISGILNSSVYLGSAASSYLNGVIVEHYGWGSIMRLWCVLAVVGLVMCLLNIRRWKKFRRTSLLSEGET